MNTDESIQTLLKQLDKVIDEKHFMDAQEFYQLKLSLIALMLERDRQNKA